MSSILPGLVVLGAALLFVALIAWAITSLRSSKRFDDPKRRRIGASLGDAFLETQSLLEPGKRHAVEQRRAAQHDVDDAGAPKG